MTITQRRYANLNNEDAMPYHVPSVFGIGYGHLFVFLVPIRAHVLLSQLLFPRRHRRGLCKLLSCFRSSIEADAIVSKVMQVRASYVGTHTLYVLL